ncbi:MAG: cytochrome c3 family protein [Planctomycetaceae bacterium]|nr:cytochrome c3 family protein [Planctomycetaceae bacterium]
MENRERFQFPAWTNKVVTLLGGVATIGGIYVVLIVNYGASPKTISAGYAPTQKIPFSHKVHAGKLKLDCRYCHNTVEKSAHAAVPPTATCLNCHSGADEKGNVAKTAVHSASPLLEPLRESAKTGEPVEWTRVHDLPDYVYFNHSAHITSGVSCVSCHGRVDQMDVVRQVAPLSMSWCLDCHRNPTPNLRPVESVTDLTWTTENPEELGEKLKDEHNIHPKTNCSTCHR